MFLTAGHCFDSHNKADGVIIPRKNGTDTPIPPHEIATNMHVTFLYQLTSGRKVSFNILKLVEYRVGNFDYAIVKLDGNPSDLAGYATIAKHDANMGDMVCIIQHPRSEPKQVDAGPVTYLYHDRIGYNDIDTYDGSSGAGILQYPEGTIVGVHITGACHLPHIGHNYGVKISELLKVFGILNMLTVNGLQAYATPSIHINNCNVIEVIVPLAQGGLAYIQGMRKRFPTFDWSKPKILAEEIGVFENVSISRSNYKYNDNGIDLTTLGVIGVSGDKLVHFWYGKKVYDSNYNWSSPQIMATGVSGYPSVINPRAKLEVLIPLKVGGLLYLDGGKRDFPEYWWNKPIVLGDELGIFEEAILNKCDTNNPIERENRYVFARTGERVAYFWRDRGESPFPDRQIWSLRDFI